MHICIRNERLHDIQELLDELQETAAAIESSGRRYRPLAEPVSIVETCAVIHRGRKLFLAEAKLRLARESWDRKEPAYTVVVILDPEVDKSPQPERESDEDDDYYDDDQDERVYTERIGTLRFYGDLPCPLRDLFDLYKTPRPIYRGGEVPLIFIIYYVD